MTPTWTHLHVHSHFSFLDGASAPEALAQRAAEFGQTALALTDWNGVYGAVVFDRACRAVGVRPLHGAEIALTDGRHLTLLVKDAEGWRSLCQLLTAAQLAGHKGHAPVAPEVLTAHTAGLLCLTGCRHGALATPLRADDGATAWRTARWLRDLYGDDLWVELPRNDHPDDRPLTHRLARLAARLGVGIVATANVHYATPAEGPLADVLACIKAGTTLEAARHLRSNHQYHLADASEMQARFAGLSEAIANTAVVAARCSFTLAFGRHVFPAVPLPSRPDGTMLTPDEQLRALCRAGLTERYAGGDPALWRRAVAQLDHELGIISHLGLASYFLIVHDVVRFARERGIPAQGRGSAASSVVSYTLGISRVEPLTNRLLFERFLSPERGSLPDIDIDFGHAWREEVIQYLYQRYGAPHVGMACIIYHLLSTCRGAEPRLRIRVALYSGTPYNFGGGPFLPGSWRGIMAAPIRGRKRERVEARVSAEQKELIERAAQLRGCSLSEYLVRSAQDAAERDLRDYEVITLSARDSQLFIEALLNPQPANAALRAAAREYQERWRAGDA